MKIGHTFLPSLYHTKDEINSKLLLKADLDGQWVKESQLPLTYTSFQLLDSIYTTDSKEVNTTVSPNVHTFNVTIPNITNLDQLKNRKITIKFHVAIPFNVNVKLNINQLGGVNISNYDEENPYFRCTTLANYILTLVYTGKVFTALDFGDSNMISGSNVDQVVDGTKIFKKMLVSDSIHSIGILNNAGYFYTKHSKIQSDTVGDTRIFNHTGYLIAQYCTVGSAVKGGGTWVDRNNIVTYVKGACAVATASTPDTVPLKANTETALTSKSMWNLLTTNTSSDITDVKTLVEQRAGGTLTPTRLIFKEYANVKQANQFEVNVGFTPNYVGTDTANIIVRLHSIATGVTIRELTLQLNPNYPVGVTSFQQTLTFTPVADNNSFNSGYEIRIVSNKDIIYSVNRVVRNTLAQ